MTIIIKKEMGLCLGVCVCCVLCVVCCVLCVVCCVLCVVGCGLWVVGLIDNLQKIRLLRFEQAFHLHREKNTAIKQLWMLPWRAKISEDGNE